jgi:hypothetical protein
VGAAVLDQALRRCEIERAGHLMTTKVPYTLSQVGCDRCDAPIDPARAAMHRRGRAFCSDRCMVAAHHRSDERLRPHPCVWCLSPIYGWRSQRYCSQRCKDGRALTERFRQRLSNLGAVQHAVGRPLVGLRACAVCGKGFLRGDARQPKKRMSYCSATCRRASDARRDAHSRAKHRRRERMRPEAPLPKGLGLVYRSRIYARDGWRCQLCRKPVNRKAKVPHPLAPTLDHIIPVSAGGRHEPSNVQLAHFECNRLRGATGPAQLRWTP